MEPQEPPRKKDGRAEGREEGRAEVRESASEGARDRARGTRTEGRRLDGRRTDPRRLDGIRTSGGRPKLPSADATRAEGPAGENPARARRRQQRELERAQRRMAMRRLTQAVVASALVLVLVVAGMRIKAYLMTTPYLALQKIEVNGVSQARDWEVKVLGEVSPGTNILSVDLVETAAKIERHPWIASATIRRSFPDTLVVEVKERAPVAILPMGELYYVDQEGTIFKKVKTGDRLSLPVLSGFGQPGPLQRGKIGRQGIKEALALMNRIAEKTPFARDGISEIHLDPDLGFSMYTANAAAQIQLGWDNFDTKLDRLGRLLNQQRLDLAQVRRIDLDLSKWAVVTPL